MAHSANLCTPSMSKALQSIRSALIASKDVSRCLYKAGLGNRRLAIGAALEILAELDTNLFDAHLTLQTTLRSLGRNWQYNVTTQE